MGFLGPEKYIAEELATKMDGRGNYETPEGKYVTSVPGVFAAGGTSIYNNYKILRCLNPCLRHVENNCRLSKRPVSGGVGNHGRKTSSTRSWFGLNETNLPSRTRRYCGSRYDWNLNRILPISWSKFYIHTHYNHYWSLHEEQSFKLHSYCTLQFQDLIMQKLTLFRNNRTIIQLKVFFFLINEHYGHLSKMHTLVCVYTSFDR